MKPEAIAGNGPAGFGLPPMVDDRHPQAVFRPFQGVWIQPLSSQKQRLELGQVIIFHHLQVQDILQN